MTTVVGLGYGREVWRGGRSLAPGVATITTTGFLPACLTPTPARHLQGREATRGRKTGIPTPRHACHGDRHLAGPGQPQPRRHSRMATCSAASPWQSPRALSNTNGTRYTTSPPHLADAVVGPPEEWAVTYKESAHEGHRPPPRAPPCPALHRTTGCTIYCPIRRSDTRNARAANPYGKRSVILAIAIGSRFLSAEPNNSETGDRQYSRQRNSPTLVRSNLIASRIISLRKR